MKLWIATEFYSPYSENTIGRFVKGIAERLEKERDVQVVFPCKRQNLGDWEHIPIHSVYPFLFARKNLILRMVGQFIMSLQFFFILLRKYSSCSFSLIPISYKILS